jgi:DNA polymerase-3 subunit epsilon
VSAHEYAPAARRVADLIAGADSAALTAAIERIATLAECGRYESAARLRDHTATAIDTLWRGQRLHALVAVGELVAAQPDGAGGWHLAVLRHGSLAAAGTAVRGAPPMPVVDALCAGAQTILYQQAPLGGALVEETALLVRWLATPGTRIVRASHGWASPLKSAGRFGPWAAGAHSARLAAAQLIDEADTGDVPRRVPRPAVTACG